MESFVDTAPAKFRSQIRPLLASVDPYRYVGEAQGKLLIQIGRADEEVTQGDLGRMGSKVCMNVEDPIAGEPREQSTGLGQIDEMKESWSIASSREAQR